MERSRSVVLLLTALMFMLAGRSWADDAAPAAKDQASNANKSNAAKPAMETKAQNSAGNGMKEANALAAAGKTEEAVAAYEKMGVLKTKKGEAWRLNNEGLAYLQANEPQPLKAIPFLEKAVATDANNFTAWNNLGTAYEQTGQLDKAKEAYQKSIDAAKMADAGASKAENNLQILQARMDKEAGKDADSDSDEDDADTNTQAKATNSSK